MSYEAMDLLLKFTIDFIQEVETKEVIADDDLVAVVEGSFGDQFSINCGAISGTEIGYPVTVAIAAAISDGGNARMEPRGA